MASWTHAICDSCWRRDNPDKHPARLRGHISECCWCGQQSTGIFVRYNPDHLPCNGTDGHHAR